MEPMKIRAVNLNIPAHALMYLGERLVKSAAVTHETYWQPLWGRTVTCGTAHCAGGWAAEWNIRGLWLKKNGSPAVWERDPVTGRRFRHECYEAMAYAFGTDVRETRLIFGTIAANSRTASKTQEIIRQTLRDRGGLHQRFVRGWDDLAAMG